MRSEGHLQTGLQGIKLSKKTKLEEIAHTGGKVTP